MEWEQSLRHALCAVLVAGDALYDRIGPSMVPSGRAVRCVSVCITPHCEATRGLLLDVFRWRCSHCSAATNPPSDALPCYMAHSSTPHLFLTLPIPSRPLP